MGRHQRQEGELGQQPLGMGYQLQGAAPKKPLTAARGCAYHIDHAGYVDVFVTCRGTRSPVARRCQQLPRRQVRAGAPRGDEIGAFRGNEGGCSWFPEAANLSAGELPLRLLWSSWLGRESRRRNLCPPNRKKGSFFEHRSHHPQIQGWASQGIIESPGSLH